MKFEGYASPARCSEFEKRMVFGPDLSGWVWCRCVRDATRRRKGDGLPICAGPHETSPVATQEGRTIKRRRKDFGKRREVRVPRLSEEVEIKITREPVAPRARFAVLFTKI